MTKSKAAAGLCAACQHDPDCILEATTSGMILQCEQFEMGFLKRATVPPAARASRSAGETNGHTGLCSNCANRETCIYPKREGGVWRCEEYA
jgi:hypothetical protein